MQNIGIIGAMDIEVKQLRCKMKNVHIESMAGLEFHYGLLEDIPAVIVKSGIGKVNAALCAQILISCFNVCCVINTGIAGAIDPNLTVMDIVVSTDAVYHDVDVTGFGYPPGTVPGTDTFFIADKRLIEAAEHAYASISPSKKLLKGRIASGDVFVTSNIVKNSIKNTFSPACVEMEGAAVGHVCTQNSIPFVIIRCISDNADDSGTNTYTFNEKEAAEFSALLTESMMLSKPISEIIKR